MITTALQRLKRYDRRHHEAVTRAGCYAFAIAYAQMAVFALAHGGMAGGVMAVAFTGAAGGCLWLPYLGPEQEGGNAA